MNSKRMKKTSTIIDFTGERYHPEIGGDIQLEHLHRYLFACQVVAGQKVLDIASGEGYGSAMLARSAYKVMGIDISPLAVEHSQKKYKHKNLNFGVGSCTDIPLKENSVDVVVSFETIEHHDDHQGMMAEVKRVLRPNGVFIISSPDKLEYTDKPDYHNPYHVKELYREEFKVLLGAHFKHHRIYGQRVLYGSAILSEEGASDVASYDLNDEKLSVQPGVPAASYLVAVASDEQLPVMGNGVLEVPINQTDLVKSWATAVAERDGRIDSLTQAVTERDGRIDSLTQAVAERDGRIDSLTQAVAERDGHLDSLKKAVNERDEQMIILTEEIEMIKSSTTWKLLQGIARIKKKF
jgi:2-polyprenyl-3-methyl-5-hydroxy-6-metoxy-1,4-benzoquinol methylase